MRVVDRAVPNEPARSTTRATQIFSDKNREDFVGENLSGARDAQAPIIQFNQPSLMQAVEILAVFCQHVDMEALIVRIEINSFLQSQS